jgi:hypothetical protein
VASGDAATARRRLQERRRAAVAWQPAHNGSSVFAFPSVWWGGAQAKSNVVVGATINASANAGIVKANSSLSAVVGGAVTNAKTIEALGSGAVVKILGSVTGPGTLLASGSGALVELDGGTISGGKLQTQSGGQIVVNFGLLNGATIASGSIVDIANGGGSRFLAGSSILA